MFLYMSVGGFRLCNDLTKIHPLKKIRQMNIRKNRCHSLNPPTDMYKNM